MSKMDPVPVPNRYRYRIYRTRYLFGTDSVPTFNIFGTGIYRFLPSNTGTEPYRTGYIRYRYWYPLLGIFGTGTFGSGTVLVPSSSLDSVPTFNIFGTGIYRFLPSNTLA
ncbi:hypothetical protein Hanom_Chr14g01256571 [Helianthus anomalus]